MFTAARNRDAEDTRTAFSAGRPSIRQESTSIERREVLTTDHVLQVALGMIDAGGIEALSMRKLGQAVNRDPMRLYSHANNKEALLGAVTELVLENILIPSAGDGDWAGGLARSAHSFREIAISHPRLVPLLVTRPSMGLGLLPPTSLRWLAGFLGCLTDAGFDGTGALQAYRFFTGFLAGHVLHEIAQLSDDSSGSTAAAYNGTAEFLLGLDIVLMGLNIRLAAITHEHLAK